MSSETKKVFITVKTYPTLSVKYDELVCTAGITDQGKWIRVYPVPFRKLEWEQQYKKYQWIEINLIRNKSDSRLESYKPVNGGSIKITGPVIKSWQDRKNIIFKEKIYSNMNTLITEARNNNISLAIFKPTKILDFESKLDKREWDTNKLEQQQEHSRQFNLFESDKPHEIFKIVKKLPYKFSYIFTDKAGKQSKMMIEDWEIGALYWNCLKKEKSEKVAVQKVKQKYFNEFKTKDLHLFLGTTKKFHNVSRNPFIIIGVFYPPVDKQIPLQGIGCF